MLVEVWCVRGKKNGFQLNLYLEGTEDELRDYLSTEVEDIVFDSYRYSACSEYEVSLVNKLHIPIYNI